jgi:hypothetical protein
MDIVHYFVFIHKYDVSESGSYHRTQAGATQMGPMEGARLGLRWSSRSE